MASGQVRNILWREDSKLEETAIFMLQQRKQRPLLGYVTLNTRWSY
jgi:hypothetical protein